MVSHMRRRSRGGFTCVDLAVTLTCFVVAGSLLVSITGATRDLSQTQVCADNLRQLFTGLAAYVNQYNSYPPHAPYPQYAPPETVNGINTGGWDPNIGFIMTYGLGLQPPATFPNGHFKWYGVPYDQLPEVCKCPAMSPSLLTLPNPELDQTFPIETLLYNYALAYQTSGTCRAACLLRYPKTATTPGVGGRNPPIPNPTSFLESKPYDNSQFGNPQGYFTRHKSGAAPDDPTQEPNSETSCYIQAVSPAEVQSPGRTYYIADGRDYRPYNASVMPGGGYPPAGKYNGYYETAGNRIAIGSRHYGYANVMYLDGRVTRDGQMHLPQWNMDYDPATGQDLSTQWRVSTFDIDIDLAEIHGQVPIMPQLSVVGWEAFFDANGMKAR
jgi:prepilin-type processing-associated H-X9-DG protein